MSITLMFIHFSDVSLSIGPTGRDAQWHFKAEGKHSQDQLSLVELFISQYPVVGRVQAALVLCFILAHI